MCVPKNLCRLWALLKEACDCEAIRPRDRNCSLLFMMKPSNPMKGKVAGVFSFLHSIIKCIGSSSHPQHVDTWECYGLPMTQNTQRCVRREETCKLYVHLPVPVRTASSHNRDIHYNTAMCCFNDGHVNLVFQLHRDRPPVTTSAVLNW